ncbi:hypothetical protein ONA91_13585 [Micromonospora sp. DR5-3]|uniref:DUF6891 domain-containing protein n=1 Tax=unclassified Micromonospora TaxID=2617518 RepID=UPI0011D4176E|nr:MULTISPECIES: hypothetical protein [unclassified Micromonospora]MCW3815486.1 hypothetical protein [Micromonospora sp. DR5-3]TYC24294.1 hypothetical protein FXF52_11120 [Micromonospora sp. MP36]
MTDDEAVVTADTPGRAGAPDDDGLALDDEIRAFVRRQVALAELPAAAIVAETVECLDGEADRVRIAELAWPVVAEELTAHLTAQQSWPARTDSDRLAAAFRALSAAGIVARESFACCQNCGLGEIGAEVPREVTPRGYAFYHQQDAERAVDGSPVFLAYGLFEQPPSVEIGEEVAAALRAEGLTVRWNGDTGSRIQVPMVWRRRRVGRLAAVPPTLDDDVDVEVGLLSAWTGVHAPRDGVQSAARLSALHLPWMPADARLRLSTESLTVTVRRAGDALVGEYADPDRRPVTVGRYEGLALLGGPPATVPSPADYVDATYEHSTGRGNAVALEAAEAIAITHRLQPHTRDFLSCLGRSGGVVQMGWEADRLWLETPHPETATVTGRHVSLAEAARMITILATEDRVAVDELGNTVTKPW